MFQLQDSDKINIKTILYFSRVLPFLGAITEYQKQQDLLEKSKIRINVQGGGRKPILTPESEICLCLFYLRQMPTFEVLGIQFDLSKTEANDTFHKWLQIKSKIIAS